MDEDCDGSLDNEARSWDILWKRRRRNYETKLSMALHHRLKQPEPPGDNAAAMRDSPWTRAQFISPRHPLLNSSSKVMRSCFEVQESCMALLNGLAKVQPAWKRQLMYRPFQFHVEEILRAKNCRQLNFYTHDVMEPMFKVLGKSFDANMALPATIMAVVDEVFAFSDGKHLPSPLTQPDTLRSPHLSNPVQIATSKLDNYYFSRMKKLHEKADQSLFLTVNGHEKDDGLWSSSAEDEHTENVKNLPSSEADVFAFGSNPTTSSSSSREDSAARSKNMQTAFTHASTFNERATYDDQISSSKIKPQDGTSFSGKVLAKEHISGVPRSFQHTCLAEYYRRRESLARSLNISEEDIFSSFNSLLRPQRVQNVNKLSKRENLSEPHLSSRGAGCSLLRQPELCSSSADVSKISKSPVELSGGVSVAPTRSIAIQSEAFKGENKRDDEASDQLSSSAAIPSSSSCKLKDEAVSPKMQEEGKLVSNVGLEPADILEESSSSLHASEALKEDSAASQRELRTCSVHRLTASGSSLKVPRDDESGAKPCVHTSNSGKTENMVAAFPASPISSAAALQPAHHRAFDSGRNLHTSPPEEEHVGELSSPFLASVADGRPLHTIVEDMSDIPLISAAMAYSLSPPTVSFPRDLISNNSAADCFEEPHINDDVCYLKRRAHQLAVGQLRGQQFLNWVGDYGMSLLDNIATASTLFQETQPTAGSSSNKLLNSSYPTVSAGKSSSSCGSSVASMADSCVSGEVGEESFSAFPSPPLPSSSGGGSGFSHGSIAGNTMNNSTSAEALKTGQKRYHLAVEDVFAEKTSARRCNTGLEDLFSRGSLSPVGRQEPPDANENPIEVDRKPKRARAASTRAAALSGNRNFHGGGGGAGFNPSSYSFMHPSKDVNSGLAQLNAYNGVGSNNSFVEKLSSSSSSSSSSIREVCLGDYGKPPSAAGGADAFFFPSGDNGFAGKKQKRENCSKTRSSGMLVKSEFLYDGEMSDDKMSDKYGVPASNITSIDNGSDVESVGSSGESDDEIYSTNKKGDWEDSTFSFEHSKPLPGSAQGIEDKSSNSINSALDGASGKLFSGEKALHTPQGVFSRKIVLDDSAAMWRSCFDDASSDGTISKWVMGSPELSLDPKQQQYWRMWNQGWWSKAIPKEIPSLSAEEMLEKLSELPQYSCIAYNSVTQAFSTIWKTKDAKRHRRNFSAIKHGFCEAHRQAVQFLMRITRRPPGVVLDTKSKKWSVCVTRKNERYRASFSLGKFGVDKAHTNAMRWYIHKRKELRLDSGSEAENDTEDSAHMIEHDLRYTEHEPIGESGMASGSFPAVHTPDTAPSSLVLSDFHMEEVKSESALDESELPDCSASSQGVARDWGGDNASFQSVSPVQPAVTSNTHASDIAEEPVEGLKTAAHEDVCGGDISGLEKPLFVELQGIFSPNSAVVASSDEAMREKDVSACIQSNQASCSSAANELGASEDIRGDSKDDDRAAAGRES